MDKPLYCERSLSLIFSETINVFTNVSFIIAAILLLKFILTKDNNLSSKRSDIFLSIMIFIVGIGSSLFHYYATLWAMFLDVIPILIFVISYFWFWSRNVFRFNLFYSIVFIGLFFITSALSIYNFRNVGLNGTEGYFGVLVFLGIISFHDFSRNRSYVLILTTFIFAFSLFFRAIDLTLCNLIPIGSHFMWHILNGVVCYFLVRVYIDRKMISRL